MNSAYAKAYAALGIAAYKDRAIVHMAFLKEKFRQADGSWMHSYQRGKAKQMAFLDDYAYLIQALIQLQEITGDHLYLMEARELLDLLIQHFSEPATGFFYFTHAQQKDLIMRKKEVYDGATPSGNAVMALNLFYLSRIFDRKDWEDHARKLGYSLRKSIIQYPGSFGIWASLLQLWGFGTIEIAITGLEFAQNLQSVVKCYIPNKIIQSGETNPGNFPLLAGRETELSAAFYICKDYSCLRPFYKLEDFLANV